MIVEEALYSRRTDVLVGRSQHSAAVVRVHLVTSGLVTGVTAV